MDATKRGLFRRLRRATSRAPLAPDPSSPAALASRGGAAGHFVRSSHNRDAREEFAVWPRVEHIVEPVWVLELEAEGRDS